MEIAERSKQLKIIEPLLVLFSLLAPYWVITQIFHGTFDAACFSAWVWALINKNIGIRLRKKCFDDNIAVFFKYAVGLNGVRFFVIFLGFLGLYSFFQFDNGFLITFFIAYFFFLAYDIACLYKFNVT